MEAQRQFLTVENCSRTMFVSGTFRSRDQPAPVGRAEEIVRRISATGRCRTSHLADEQGAAELDVTMLPGVQIEHELAECPLEPGELALSGW